MPQVEIPGVGLVEFPDGMSQAQITRAIERDILPRVQRTEAPAPVEAPPAQTSWWDDTRGSVVSGVGGVLSGVGGIAGLVTGNYNTGAARLGRSLQETGQEMMSPGLRQRRDEFARSVEEAGERGVLPQAGAALSGLATDPYMTGQYLIEQFPQLAASLGIGRGAMAAGQFAARRAGQEAAEAAGRRAAVGASIGAGAGLQTGDVANETYNDVMRLAPEVLERSDNYRALRQTMTDQEAREALAVRASREAAAIAAPISVGTAALFGAERMAFLNGARRSAISRVVLGFAQEGTQEAIEEGGGRFAQNVGASRADPDRDLTQGVGGAAAQGLVLGGIMGGGINAIAGRGPEPDGVRGEDPDLRRALTDFVSTRGDVSVGPGARTALQQQADLVTNAIPQITTEQFMSAPPEMRARMVSMAQDRLANQGVSRLEAAEQKAPRRREDPQSEMSASARTGSNETLIGEAGRRAEAMRFEAGRDQPATAPDAEPGETQAQYFMRRSRQMTNAARNEGREDPAATTQSILDGARQTMVADLGTPADQTARAAQASRASSDPLRPFETLVEAYVRRFVQTNPTQALSVPALQASLSQSTGKPVTLSDARALLDRYVLSSQGSGRGFVLQKDNAGRYIPVNPGATPPGLPTTGGEPANRLPEGENAVFIGGGQYRPVVATNSPLRQRIERDQDGTEQVTQLREVAYRVTDRDGNRVLRREFVPVDMLRFPSLAEQARETTRRAGEFSARDNEQAQEQAPPPGVVRIPDRFMAGENQGGQQTQQVDADRQAKEKTYDAARSVIFKRLEALKAKGEQGRRLRNALIEALNSGTFDANQLYAAFIAADQIANILPAGAAHDVRFVERLLINQQENAAAQSSGGQVGQEAQGRRVRPISSAVSGLIEISLAPNQLPLLRETAAHEAFHVLQDYYRRFDPQFDKLMSQGFRDGMTIADVDPTIRRKLQTTRVPNSQQSYWDLLSGSLGNNPISAREAQAYVFGSLMDAAKRGMPMSGLKPAYARFVNMIRQFFQRMGNALRGNGFRNASDLLERVAQGDARRFTQSSPTQQDLGVTGSEMSARALADQPGVDVEQGNKLGFEPALRVVADIEGLSLTRQPLIVQDTNNGNAARQLDAVTEVLKAFPNPENSPAEWARMEAYAFASPEVPIPPYNFMRDLNGGAVNLLRTLTPGQIADADHGFANAKAFRRAYTNKELTPITTGKLFLWSFLSRGVSPYTQESLFIDAFNGADAWIKKAAAGNFTEADFNDYEAWAKSVAPAGSGQPGAGATHNLNAFGQKFLFKMARRDAPGGVSRLQYFHDLMERPDITGQQIRREFVRMASDGVGIDNKVVSFTLLVSGFTDVMVLDRVQMRRLWDDGRFSNKNLYDGETEERLVNGKRKMVTKTGTSLSNLTYGARGLLIYEAIERALARRISDIYASVGRAQDASIGRYHWETWVADSQQEASHGSIDAILADARGDDRAIARVTAKQGEYGAYEYGARYARDDDGTPYFVYDVGTGQEMRFSVPAFRAFLDEVKDPASGVVPRSVGERPMLDKDGQPVLYKVGKKKDQPRTEPVPFSVSESGNAPWFTRPQVNRGRLAELASSWADRGGGTGDRARAVLQDASRPEAARGDGAGTRGELSARSTQDAARARAGELRDGRGLRGGEGLLASPRGVSDGSEEPLEGLPRRVKAPGFGIIEAGPFLPARRAAAEYMRDAGLSYNPPTRYAKVDPERASRIADAYEAMVNNINDPLVRASYEAMARETMAQWEAIKRTGFRAEFFPEDGSDPYSDNPRFAIEDVRNNNHMYVFSTEAGYGQGGIPDAERQSSPMLRDTGERWNGKPVLVNDVFRAVHDYFGHAKEGVGFRADGEENAWRSHAAMYSPLARLAMTTETRGQNSWLNYGPLGEKNRTAKTGETVFAEQKLGVLPSWVHQEGAEDFLSAIDVDAIRSSLGLRADQSTDTGMSERQAELSARQLNITTREFTNWWNGGWNPNGQRSPSIAVNPDGSPKTYYHGTPRSFRRFDKARSGSVRGEQGPFFFTDDPDFASDYAESDMSAGGRGAPVKQGSKIYPVYLSAQNPFDYQNPDHVRAVLDAVRLPANNRSMDAMSVLRDSLRMGMWRTLERAEVQRAIRDLGFDGFFMKESGRRNLAVYDPRQVKSIFNSFEQGASTRPEFSARQINTPEFRRWFGDSKVVDENGQPLVVYHGTSRDKDFTGFKTGPRGAWFTTDPREASSYAEENDSGYKVVDYDPRVGYIKKDTSARVIPAYLSIKNPAVLTEAQDYKLRNSKSYSKAQAEVFAEMKSQGYDGVKLNDNVWVAFNPTQIKSAIGNRGTFDPDNPRIDYSARQINTPEFRRWFGDSKVVDEDGQPLVVYHGTPKKGLSIIDPRRAMEVSGVVFFTSSEEVADQYQYEREYGEIVGREAGDIKQAYLRIINPLVVDFDGDVGDVARISPLVQRAKREGFDGLIIRNVDDTVDSSGVVATSYAVFKPTQIKSATDNRGTFDPDNPRIDYSARQSPSVLDRIPELEEAAKGLKNGTITRERYEELVNSYKPVLPYDSVPDPASVADMRRALTADKVDRIGVPSRTLERGDPVGLRLDIPAYANHGVWVVSVHEQQAGYAAGKSIGYESVAAVTNPTFGVVQGAALNIAAGKPKATIAVVKGDWLPVTPDQAMDIARDAMEDSDWVQVGMDPTRHAYFYDRSNMEPVVRADEVIQIGPLVLAKNPVYGAKSDYQFSARAALSSDPVLAAFREKATGKEIVAPNVFRDGVSNYIQQNPFLRRMAGALPGETLRQALVRTTINRAAPLWMLDRLAKEKGLSVQSAGLAMEVALNNTGRVQMLLDYGPLAYDAATGDVTVRDDAPSLLAAIKGRLKPSQKLDAQAYLVALREKDLRRNGRVGFLNATDAEVNDVVARYEREHPEWRAMADDLQKINKALLDFAVATGTLDRSKAGELAQMFYTPFYRKADEEAQTASDQVIGPKLNDALTNVKTAFDVGLKGGEKPLGDLFENIIRNADVIMKAGMKNVAMRTAAEVMEQTGIGQFVQAKEQGKTITYRVNGKDKHFRVEDPVLFTALAGAPRHVQNGIYQTMANVASFFRDMVTSAPSFMLANLWRGKQMAYVQEGLPFYTNTFDGLRQAMKASSSYKAISAQTGFGGYTYGMGERDAAKAFEREIGGLGYGPGGMLRRAFQGLQKVSEATEFAERIKLYERMRAQGMTDKEAAYQAYLLAPFSRRGMGGGWVGSTVNWLVPLVPFLNAKLQGMYRLYENEKGDKQSALTLGFPRQLFLRGLVLMAATMALAAKNMGDEPERWDDETPDLKFRYDIIYLPGDKRILLPRAFEVGSWFGAMPVFIADAIRRDDGRDIRHLVTSLGTSTFFFNPIPQAVIPLIGATTNYDFFRGRELETKGDQGLPVADRANRSTTAAMRYLGSQLGISPIRLQYLVEGYTGSIGSAVLAGFDSALGAAGAIPEKPAGAFGDPAGAAAIIAGLTGASRFFRGDEQSVSRFVGDFYRIKEMTEQLTRSFNRARETNDTERLAELRGEAGLPLRLRPMVNAAAQQVEELNKRMRMIERRGLSSEDLAAALAPLRQRRDAITRRVVERAVQMGVL